MYQAARRRWAGARGRARGGTIPGARKWGEGPVGPIPGRYRCRAMAAAVRTTVTELPESRVRVAAEVPADEVQRRIDEKARALGRELKIPGFRRGKVPPPVVLRRLGRETVLDETVRDAIGRWYTDAVE